MGPKPKRYQHQRCLHFITFSCYRRMPLLDSVTARGSFERELERVRRWYGCYVTGYVVMPEHVHLLISEPERNTLSVVIQTDHLPQAEASGRASFLADSLLRLPGLE
jgi:putative transposase